ncbi:MAG: flagellar biosynthesis protein FliQ [Desulfobacterales bacterium]|jgi:flagellar biosynthetic protein FliQ|nr:flagellar biosynthesis protein FliQ [Desulfobacterales bacterium]
MNADYITGFFFEAIKVTILLASPMLLAGLAVGLMVSIFQSATSINEMTLTFIPKMLAVAAALIFFFPWMMQTIVGFTEQMFMNMNQFIR